MRCMNCGLENSERLTFCNECGAPLGEPKPATVLFADRSGSMELLVNCDPEKARAILDPVPERIMAAIHHSQGTVNQVIGDGNMAMFGAPITHEDHAVGLIMPLWVCKSGANTTPPTNTERLLRECTDLIRTTLGSLIS
jgi:class 3 adenylate cyclase